MDYRDVEIKEDGDNSPLVIIVGNDGERQVIGRLLAESAHELDVVTMDEYKEKKISMVGLCTSFSGSLQLSEDHYQARLNEVLKQAEKAKYDIVSIESSYLSGKEKRRARRERERKAKKKH